jgi:hypothetical protein
MMSIWTPIVEKTHEALLETGITNIKFDSFKNDDTYVKAKTGTPGVFLAFARRSDDVWIELEIKPRTRQGNKIPQKELYDSLKNHRNFIEKNCGFKITWDEEDRVAGYRRADGGDFRIKSYIPSSSGSVTAYADELASRMVKFIQTLQALSKNEDDKNEH